MSNWVYLGGLAFGVLFLFYEIYRDREGSEGAHSHGGSDRDNSHGDFVRIEEIDSDELERRLRNRSNRDGRNITVPTKDDDCSICLEKLIKREAKKSCIVSLPHCGHWFHQKCALRLLEYHPSCPVCRVQIDKAMLRNTPVHVLETDEGETSDRNNTQVKRRQVERN